MKGVWDNWLQKKDNIYNNKNRHLIKMNLKISLMIKKLIWMFNNRHSNSIWALVNYLHLFLKKSADQAIKSYQSLRNLFLDLSRKGVNLQKVNSCNS